MVWKKLNGPYINGVIIKNIDGCTNGISLLKNFAACFVLEIMEYEITRSFYCWWPQLNVYLIKNDHHKSGRWDDEIIYCWWPQHNAYILKRSQKVTTRTNSIYASC